jgi:hypothetical protein
LRGRNESVWAKLTPLIYDELHRWGVGPRVEEPGINLIRSFSYSGPLEYVRVKRP